VDHLFIFEGKGAIYDFPGNYSEYRSSQRQSEIEIAPEEIDANKKTADMPSGETEGIKSKKLTYKEKKEFEQLTVEIALLEEEKRTLESSLSDHLLNADELIRRSNRIGELISLIDRNTDRWLALSES